MSAPRKEREDARVAYLASANEIGYVLSTVRPAFADEPEVVAAIDALTEAVGEWREGES